METKINVAEILKDKSQGTKLYDLLRNIDVELDKVHTTDVGTYIECTSTNEVGSTLLFDYSKLGTEKCWLEGLRILLPSKNMRDWGKFAWKKGDVLINSCGFQCIFKEWASDDYTKFNGCYSNSRDGYEDVSNAETAKFDKLDNNIAYGYVREIERKLGGILNLETLEIEKTQPEFKDGDILCVIDSSDDYHYILIYKGQDDKHIYRYVTMFENNFLHIRKDAHLTKPKDYSMRYATEEEKQQLFDALAKKDKAWDAEKKQIVDLKPKCEFKPFDKVLGRNEKDDVWEAELFSHYREESQYPFRCIGFGRKYCIPYNEETAHLLGTTDDWEGGEQ
jgi:hypothetical protein